MPEALLNPPGNPELTEEEVEEWFEEEDDETSNMELAATPVPEESLEKKYAESQLRIVRTAHDFTLHTLRESLRDPNYINLSPDYQRRTRWDRKRRSQLIESFLMNVPVPPIFLFENRYNQYEVMDGRQRLETIRDFLDNRFALTGLEFWKELKNKRYSELGPTIQRGLLRRSISAIILLAETTRPDEADVDVRMLLFRRLNTGGARLNPQELRNALYPGHFNGMLMTLSRSDVFTRLWRIPPRTAGEKENPPAILRANALFRTMADCELVLRFFAIREMLELNLKGALTRLLDSCMVRHASDDESNIRRLSALYMRCLERLDDIFDKQPFALPNERLSRPLYDALMVAISRLSGFDPISKKSAIQARLKHALNDPDVYPILVGRGNTIDAIKERVSKAENILTGTEHS